MSQGGYVLVSAARNEEENIERTIESIISQTILPQKWVIVSDGSTDQTDEIVGTYAKDHNFIELIKSKGDPARNFGSKSRAIQLARERLKKLDYDYIGNLDADIYVDPTYYETILEKFRNNERLGVAGGVRYDLLNGDFERVLCAHNSVAGAFQVFTRQCFDAINGYMALKYGGVDTVAETMARMKGWEVESFPECSPYHFRATGSANGNFVKTWFRYGLKLHAIGYHPLFLVLMIFRRMLLSRSWLLGGPFQLAGYTWAALCRYERPVGTDLVRFLRREQVARLKSTLLLKGRDPILKVSKL